MKSLLTLLALLLAALAVQAQTSEPRVGAAPRIRLIQAPAAPTEPAQTRSAGAPSACPSHQIDYAGMCWDKAPQTGSYFGVAAHCGDSGGRLPGLGELAGFTARFAVSGTECSSDFDAGAGTLWCANAQGVSGMGLSQQAKSLYEINAPFRCVRPYPR